MAKCNQCQAGTKQFLQWVLATSFFRFFENLSGDAILPQVVLSMVCKSESNHLDNKTSSLALSPECNDKSKKTIVKATDWYKVISRDNGIASLMTITMMAVVSDSIGRKPIISLVTIGIALDRLAIVLSSTLSMIHYFHTATGLFASKYLLFAVAFSAIADKSSHQTRSKDFSWLEAGIYCAVIIGPYGGGTLVKKFALETPFYVTSAGCLLTAVYVVVFIPEPNPSSQGTKIICGCHGVSVACLATPTDDTESTVSLVHHKGMCRHQCNQSTRTGLH